MIPVQKVLVRYTVTAGVLEYAVPFARLLGRCRG